MTEHPKTSTARTLQAGWCWATLDQLFSSITDGDHSAPPQVEEGIPFLVIGDVRGGIIDFSDTRYVARDYYAAIGESRKPRKGDLLYTVTGSFGIPVVVESEREFCVQRHIAILKPTPEASVRYLAFALATTEAYYQAVDAATGTAQKTVGLQRLRQFRVPLATVREQKRIVEAIESYFTRLDDAVATLERVESNLKRYRASVLKAAVEGRLVPTEAALAKQEGRLYEPASVLLDRILAERRRRWSESGKKGKYQEPAPPDTTNLPDLPEGWCWATVEQITAADRSSGYGVLVPGPDVPDGVLLIRVGDIRDGRVHLGEIKRISKEIADQFQRTYLKGGELLLSLVGSIGRTAVVPAALAGANVARAVGVIPIAEAIDSRWVEHWFRSPVNQARMVGLAHEVARKTLNLEDVRGAFVAVPPRQEQARIVDAVSDLESLTDESARFVEFSRQRTIRLRQSILKWAFEGKLADQDPKDEPASVLLERIKAEREAGKLAKTTARERAAMKKQVRA